MKSVKDKIFSNRIVSVSLWITMLLAGVSFLFTSCATVPIPKQEYTEDSLRGTASMYWKLRMEDKYEDTFKMENKEALQKVGSREKPMYESYTLKARAIKSTSINSYSIKDVTLEDDKGSVNVEFVFTLPEMPRPVHQIVTDGWIFRNGKWLHLFPR